MIAVIRGPYCTGAVTPSGATPHVVAPQQQRRAISWCSVTRTVIGGRSNTCRRSIPTSGASVRSAPHPVHGPGRAAAAGADPRPEPASTPDAPAGHPACAPLAAQRLRSGFDERRVRRRRLGRVRRVHPQPAPQLRVLSAKPLVVRTQLSNLDPKLLDQPRLRHHQVGKLVIRPTPVPDLHTMIIPCWRSRPRNNLTSYVAGPRRVLSAIAAYFTAVPSRT